MMPTSRDYMLSGNGPVTSLRAGEYGILMAITRGPRRPANQTSQEIEAPALRVAAQAG